MGIHLLPTGNYRLFSELRSLVSAVEHVSVGRQGRIAVSALERLGSHLILVEPSDRRRNYRIVYSGDQVDAAWGIQFEGLKFQHIRERHPKTAWPRVRQSLQGFSDACVARAPVFRVGTVNFGPRAGTPFARLILPVMQGGRVGKLAAAFAFDGDEG